MIPINDFKKFFTGKIGDYKLRKFSVTETTLFFITKVFYFTYMLVIPAFFLFIMIVTHVLMALIGSLMVLGVDGNPWSLFLSVVNPFKAWGMIAASYIAQSVWALPLYGWLMLVSAFAGREKILKAYQLAIDHKYRFYSYGDAMLIC